MTGMIICLRLPALTNVALLGQWAIARLQAEAKEQLANLLRKPTKDSSRATKDEVPFIGPSPDPNAVQINDQDSEQESAKRPNLRLGSYSGVYSKRNGTLYLNLNQMHFETQLTGTSSFHLKYSQLKSLRKVANPGSKNPLSHTADAADEGILLIDIEDREYSVTGLKERDEVFTQIIGYSGLQWQITG
jgi:hypothetical protein